MLCGLISKTSGQAKVAGYEVGNDADSLAMRAIIGLVPDIVGLCDELSASETSIITGSCMGVLPSNGKTTSRASSR